MIFIFTNEMQQGVLRRKSGILLTSEHCQLQLTVTNHKQKNPDPGGVAGGGKQCHYVFTDCITSITQSITQAS